MTIAEIASVAVKNFVGDDQIVMTAIAGAESGWNPRAAGDPLDSFTEAQRRVYKMFASNDMLSFGAWQIFLGVHTPLVRSMSGFASPEDLSLWLTDPDNNARVAKAILQTQGFTAWSTYTDRQYQQFTIEASAAVREARDAADHQQKPTYVAFSLNGSKVHLDRADGSFEEYDITTVGVFQPWLRFEIA